jgi:PilZ domain
VIQRERRKSERFLIRLPITVRWRDENHTAEAETVTRDVSSCGLRFDLPNALKSGSMVQILMTLPRQLTQSSLIQVNCQGRVVRISSDYSDQVEVAATIQRFQFMRDAESAA